MQVLRGHPHEQGGLVDELLGDEARVRVDALAHRVAAHVLDATGHDHVVGAEGDAAGGGGHGGQRAGAHAVDRVAGDGLRQARQQCCGAADRQTLVADLRGGRDRDLVDALDGQVRVTTHELPDALDDEVVGTGLVVDALRACLAERGADAIDEDDVPRGTRHGGSPPRDQRFSGQAAASRRTNRRGRRRPRPCYPPVTTLPRPGSRNTGCVVAHSVIHPLASGALPSGADGRRSLAALPRTLPFDTGAPLRLGAGCGSPTRLRGRRRGCRPLRATSPSPLLPVLPLLSPAARPYRPWPRRRPSPPRRRRRPGSARPGPPATAGPRAAAARRPRWRPRRRPAAPRRPGGPGPG